MYTIWNILFMACGMHFVNRSYSSRRDFTRITLYFRYSTLTVSKLLKLCIAHNSLIIIISNLTIKTISEPPSIQIKGSCLWRYMSSENNGPLPEALHTNYIRCGLISFFSRKMFISLHVNSNVR